MSFNSYRSWKGSWREYAKNYSVSTDNFYIINYQPVSSALNSSANTNKIKASNFKNCTYSSVSSVLGYYDALTGKKYTFGVQSNDNGNVSSSNVYNLTSSLSNGVNNLNSSSLVKCVSAESLKTVIASNKDLATSENTFYTTSSFKSYSEAYANAVSYLAQLMNMIYVIWIQLMQKISLKLIIILLRRQISAALKNILMIIKIFTQTVCKRAITKNTHIPLI